MLPVPRAMAAMAAQTATLFQFTMACQPTAAWASWELCRSCTMAMPATVCKETTVEFTDGILLEPTVRTLAWARCLYMEEDPMLIRDPITGATEQAAAARAGWAPYRSRGTALGEEKRRQNLAFLNSPGVPLQQAFFNRRTNEGLCIFQLSQISQRRLHGLLCFSLATTFRAHSSRQRFWASLCLTASYETAIA